jgi:hypothetical protein
MSTWVKRRALGAGPAIAGATSQASAAIGSAAVTHTASTVRREYCLIEGSVLVDAVLTEDVNVISGSTPSCCAGRSLGIWRNNFSCSNQTNSAERRAKRTRTKTAQFRFHFELLFSLR